MDSEPECALSQIYLLVAPVEGPLHKGGHGGIRQIDLLVLPWAAAFLIRVEVSQLRQQLANGALQDVDLDLKRPVFTCKHHSPVSVAGQASGLHVNPQLNLLNLRSFTHHTTSRGTKHMRLGNLNSAAPDGRQ